MSLAPIDLILLSAVGPCTLNKKSVYPKFQVPKTRSKQLRTSSCTVASVGRSPQHFAFLIGQQPAAWPSNLMLGFQKGPDPKGPRTQITGLWGPNIININGIWELRNPYYLGPWTLRVMSTVMRAFTWVPSGANGSADAAQPNHPLGQHYFTTCSHRDVEKPRLWTLVLITTKARNPMKPLNLLMLNL